MTSRAGVVVVAAVLADRVLGDPARWHPVAGYGWATTRLERRLYGDSRLRGVLFAAVAVGVPAGAATLADRWCRPRTVLRSLLGSAVLWACLGGSSLVAEGRRMAELLVADDLPAARARLSHLCARDPADLTADGLARATVESLAENTSDAAVAPLFWAAVAGVPGVVAYRAANTLDAMVGYRDGRYARFGWASARLDDVLNLAPARACALLTCLLAPTVGGSIGRAVTVLRRDGGHHPSPNAGRCEAAFAGALDVTVGGTNSYHGTAETRGRLGDGPPPSVDDIARAARLSGAVVLAAAALAAWARR